MNNRFTPYGPSVDTSPQGRGVNLVFTSKGHGNVLVSKLYFNLSLYLGYNLHVGFLVFWIQFNGSKSVSNCYIVGLGLNCKFIDLLFKRSFIKFIEISSHLDFIVSEIIYNQINTLTQGLMDLR